MMDQLKRNLTSSAYAFPIPSVAPVTTEMEGKKTEGSELTQNLVHIVH